MHPRSVTFAVLTIAIFSAPAAEISGRATVIDGDSLVIGNVEIRLHGIDAPEGRQLCQVKGKDWRCGQAAAETLSMLVQNRDVRCNWDVQDSHGRALATCYREALEINAMMVQVGMALAYRHYSGIYIDEEAEAKTNARGIWDAQFIPPWEWRAQERRTAASPSDCPVKGNVNRNGERIYHLRGSRHYDRVTVRPHEGDRCFGSAADADAAGFRAAAP